MMEIQTEPGKKSLIYSRDQLMNLRYSPGSKLKPVLVEALYRTEPNNNQPNVGHKEKNIVLRSYMVSAVPAVKDESNEWRQRNSGSSNADMLKLLRSILNKLSHSNFDILLVKVSQLEMLTHEQMAAATQLIFEKAVNEPFFSANYALMCKALSTKEPKQVEFGDKKNLRYFLLSQCQREFERGRAADLVIEAKRKELDAISTQEERNRLTEELVLMTDENRRRSLGNVKFIGELYKVGMIATSIIKRCMQDLLKCAGGTVDGEEALENLCRMLTTVGHRLSQQMLPSDLNFCFSQLTAILRKGETSNRIRFMIQDVIELKNRKWQEREKAQPPPPPPPPTAFSQPVESQKKQVLYQSLSMNEWRVPKLQTPNENIRLAPPNKSYAQSVKEVEKICTPPQPEMCHHMVVSRLSEYFNNKKTHESIEDLQDWLQHPVTAVRMIEQFLTHTLERKSSERRMLGVLLSELMSLKLISSRQFYDALAPLVESAEDMLVDIPQFWHYLDEIINPLVTAGFIDTTVLGVKT